MAKTETADLTSFNL